MSTFSELIDFTRSSTGTYLDSVVYGDELVQSTTQSGVISNTNNDPYFTVENRGQVSVSNDVLTFNNTQWESVRRNVGMVIGKYYKVSFTVNVTSGNVAVYKNGATNIGNFTTGTHSVIYKQEAAINLQFSSGGFVGTVSNVSVKEIIGGQGTAGTPLLRTADTNEPRLEYDASGQPLGLLIEEQRTNLVTQSTFNSGWTGGGIILTNNVEASPDGLYNASKLVWTATTTYHSTFVTINVNANTTYTRSVYVKYAGVQWIHLQQYDAGGAQTNLGVWFDIKNGIKGSEQSGVTGTIEDVGNGWYRCSATNQTSTGTTSERVQISLTSANGASAGGQTGDGVSGIYLYGAQLEQGAFPTSYIPTSGSTVTRNKDVCKVTAFKYHQNDQQGTLFVEGTPNISQATYRRFAEFEYSNLKFSIQTYTGKIASYTRNAANSTNNSIGTQNPYTPYRTQKSAFTVSAGYAAKSNNGLDAQSETDVLGLDEPNVDLYIGQQDNGADQLCGHIKRVLYFPTKLSNDELVELTKPSSSPTMSLTFDGQATSELVEGLHD